MVAKKTKILIACCLAFGLSGCWNNIEINRSLLVIGTAIDRSETGYNIFVEIIKPSIGAAQEEKVRSIVLQETGATLLETARSFIRKGKRRLIFTHNRVWVLSEAVAEKNILKTLDSLKRDQMLRLNSFLFITPKNPEQILTTPALIENLSSMELASSMQAAQYTSEYRPLTIREFYKAMSGPVPAVIVPMIKATEGVKKPATAIFGSAIIKNDRMVGRLNMQETKGALWLRNEVRGGVLVTREGEDLSALEVTSHQISVTPHLNGTQATFDVRVKLSGTLGELPPDAKLNEAFLRSFEHKVNQKLEQLMIQTVKKVQKEKVDVLRFGLRTYRKYPRQWHDIKDDWDDIFANAQVNFSVNSSIDHPGLSRQSEGHIYRKPQRNPYPLRQNFMDREEE